MLFVFGIGTLPVLFLFGLLTSVISGRLTQGLLKASGALVIALGLLMVNRGLTLSGTGYDFRSLGVLAAVRFETLVRKWTEAHRPEVAGYQTIRMAVTRKGFEPDTFVLKKDVPVRWVIVGKELTSCNRAIVVPALGLQLDLVPGEQVIEFTPKKAGIIPWSCWMGMIPGTFVVENGAEPGSAKTTEKPP